MAKNDNCSCEQAFHLAIYICKLCDQVICPKKVLQNLYTKKYYCPNGGWPLITGPFLI
ncbi:hypothetical protein [Spiroplasma endosymbiont of Villa modesta]|uniref:hypothetical protein n=1 Tax=Spiroplasma endosymbiont of Villa modesta TaxID=3066293 RepID=UPI00313BEDE8